MKKIRIAKLWLTACFVLGMMLMPKSQMKAEAANIITTVEGTVSNKTSADILFLSTKDGMMEIKVDSTTEASGIKVLLPGSKIYVSVTGGNDGYLHAAKLFTDAPSGPVTLDMSNSVTVSGKINAKSTQELLYFNASNGGEMQIKLDDTTKISPRAVLVLNRTYNITCVRGSDAFLHAVSIDDPAGTTASSSGWAASSPVPASVVTAQTTVFTGTVGSNTTESLLYFMTSGGEMQIVIDANTDSRYGMVLTPGRQLTLTAYRGSDAYMHAAVIMGSKAASQAVQIDSANPLTVTGTVSSKSTEDLLYLNTSQGEMLLKLDAVYNVSGCKVLTSGKQLTVTCARGADAYLHALTIKGN